MFSSRHAKSVSRAFSSARVLADDVLDERYRNGGPMREGEPHVRDLVDEMNFAARDHRVLANQLNWMGHDGDMPPD